MAGGLDEYLASWITKEHVLQVTTDAKTADLVMTDHLGKQVEQRLAELHPRDEDDDEGTSPRFRGGQGRGTVFLLDAKTRAVVWSDFHKPGDRSASRMSREARRLAIRLRSSFTK